jgi:hypothetical protein
MRLLHKLGILAASAIAFVAGPSGHVYRPEAEVKSDINRRRTNNIVGRDRDAIAAAEEKRKRRQERNKELGLKSPQILQWMPASKLPMVDTPLLILVKKEPQDVVYKAERRNWVSPADKEGSLLFYGEFDKDDFPVGAVEGDTLTGRFPWTYP